VQRREEVNIISAYATQVGVYENMMRALWEHMDELVQAMTRPKNYVVGDLNSHLLEISDFRGKDLRELMSPLSIFLFIGKYNYNS